MVLVVGRPGSGCAVWLPYNLRVLTTVRSCTTFLKTITNRRGGYMSVEGDVSYGGISAAEMLAKYAGEVVYNQEDDVHHATLTVAQTIMFALNTKARLFFFLLRALR